jgi:hypothetical protein
MLTGEIEIERLAHAMIERHGGDAAKAALAQLNKTIDRCDWEGRERWACVVRVIHENQEVGSSRVETAAQHQPIGASLLEI